VRPGLRQGLMPKPDPRRMLRALLVADAPDLDLPMWNRAIEERESAGVGVEG
jgi:hypothetical protein